MDRDSSGFRSWFQRAMQLSPSLASSTFPHAVEDDDDVDEVDVVDNGVTTDSKIDWLSNDATNVLTAEPLNGQGQSGESFVGRSRRNDMYTDWCLLQEDNVRLWDCLAMLRTDPTITCPTAIHIATQSPNSDYFPKDVRSGFKNFFKDDGQMVVEVLRLSVENQKLHAVLWVLADNPVIRVDSVLAAVFRLNDEQFREKFKFEYRPGCFSDKGMVMGVIGRDDKSSVLISHSKRCRSSSPIRSYKPARTVSDRVSQSVSRRATSRRGGQNNSSNRRCHTEKLEPSRKHPDVWMMSALLAELDNKSSNRAWLKMLKFQLDQSSKGDLDVESNEEDEDDADGNENTDINKNEDYSEENQAMSECIQLSHQPAKNKVIKSSLRNKPRSHSRGKNKLRFTVHNIDKGGESNNCSNNCVKIVEETVQEEDEKEDDGVFEKFFLEDRDSKWDMGIAESIRPSWLKNAVSHHIYEDLLHSDSQEDDANKTIKVQNHPPGIFGKQQNRWRHSLTGVIYNEKIQRHPDITVPLNIATPYRFNANAIPADFISRQEHITKALRNKERQTDLYFCPVSRFEVVQDYLPPMYWRRRHLRKQKGPNRCCESKQWKKVGTKHCIRPVDKLKGNKPEKGEDDKPCYDCGNKIKPLPPINGKKDLNEGTSGEKPESEIHISTSGKDSDSNVSIQQSHKSAQCPIFQGKLPGCCEPSDECKRMRRALHSLGKKQYTGPLRQMVKRSVHCQGI